jgi:DNA end-binding protein Ku
MRSCGGSQRGRLQAWAHWISAGPVEEDEIVKGYEFEKGRDVMIRPEEIDALKLEAKHTIELKTFVDRAEIDHRYRENPYYVMPEVLVLY